MRFGKTPARPGAIRLRFGDVFRTGALPTPPTAFGHENLVKSWGMLANDSVGDCVLAGACHEHMLWTASSGVAPDASFTDADALAAYSAITGYVPGNESTDQGTDMQAAADYRRKIGVRDVTGAVHQITAYASVGRGNVTEIASAAYVLGAVGIGFEVPESVMDAFDAGQPWTVVQNSPIVGGHYVPCVGRAANGNLLVVSWGRVCEMTIDFLERYNDENVAYVCMEYIDKNKVTPENFDADYLGNFLKELS